jgi:hypothetical protein
MNQKTEIEITNKSNIELYRKILGNNYKYVNDADIILLANRIRWFCHSFINSHLQDFPGKKDSNFLNFYQEENE